MGFFVLALMAFSWCALAAYVGMAAFLTSQPGIPRLGIFIFTALVILIPTVCFLFDQDSYFWLDRLSWRDATSGRAFWTGSFLLNACFFGGMALSFFSTRLLPEPLRGRVRRFSAYASLPSMLWLSMGARSLFLPPVFIPDEELLISRLLFLLFFLLVSIGTFCLLASCEPDRN